MKTKTKSPTTDARLKHGRIVGIYRQRTVTDAGGNETRLPINYGRNAAKRAAKAKRAAGGYA